MFVVKRNGERQRVAFDKITARIRSLCEMEPRVDESAVDPAVMAQQVIQGLRNGMTTAELDNLASETLAYRTIEHPAYGVVAARIEVSNLHKTTRGDFVAVTWRLREAGLVREDYCDFVLAHAEALRGMVDYSRDYAFDFFGMRTLARSYLLNIGKEVVERPQDMWMRVAVELSCRIKGSGAALANVRATYDALSRGLCTHATPTLFAAGMPRSQMSSCFLLAMREDSIDGIFDTMKQCALISKYAGGIGLSVSSIRATGSYIKGTNGRSNGLVPMLRIFNNVARYVDQGGGKRKGSFAMYVEPWHADIEDFLELKKNHGKDESRARDLFYAMWMPDLFMERVRSRGTWSLFCPHECPGLADTYGAEFEALYERYEAEGRARKQMPAVVLWQRILTSQVETGTPYVLFKDHINRKSQQSNVGVIRSSNLCAEIVEHTSPEEVAVCNLASISLSRFVAAGAAEGAPEASLASLSSRFDFAGLEAVVRLCVGNLNSVVDGNMYPVPEARRSNLRNRPVGLGVQGWADVLAMLRLPFESEAADLLNRAVFETMYLAAAEASAELAARDGAYESFAGSPASRGQLQFDLWAERGHFDLSRLLFPERWAAVKARISEHGLRNSLLIALMPTASTSQILGNNECFEPFTSNLYTRRTLAGEFVVANRHLQEELLARGLWNRGLVEKLMAENGSVQNIPELPASLREVYKTVWEIPQRTLLDMAAARGPFVDQTQSMNVFLTSPTPAKVSSMLFYGWTRGLKTGLYYLRTKPSAQPIKFTVSTPAAPAGSAPAAGSTSPPREEEEEGCLSCSA
jgi:ribonucleoside-diphosphate reductase alpha subunit